MTMTYVFPDLHGRLDHLHAALKAVHEDGAADGDTMVFLGDYIDRGPESAQLVKRLRELQEARERVICLSGNHEVMMMGGLSEGGEWLTGWLLNGGGTTVTSYTDAQGIIDDKAMAEDCAWFASLPTYHEDARRVYVHAGVEAAVELVDQPVQTLHWKRYETLDGRGWMDKHVVHGHDADETGPKTIGNRTACDTGAVWTGRYVVSVFDDDKAGGPVRVLEVLA